MIPPTTRTYIAGKVETTTSWFKSGLLFSGKTLWVISTSALLLGVPWALAFAEEQQMVEMEKEMRMREMGSEVRRSSTSWFLPLSLPMLTFLYSFCQMEDQVVLELLMHNSALNKETHRCKIGSCVSRLYGWAYQDGKHEMIALYISYCRMEA